MSSPQSESQFGQEVDAILQAIEESLDQAGADIEYETVAGILTIDCVGEEGGGGKIIVNRQTPNREIWVAAKSGGFHFRKVGGDWVDTRGGPPLAARLAQCIEEQSGERITLSISPG